MTTHKAKLQKNNIRETFQLWSFRPILIWLNLIGLPFNIAKKESVIRFGCATCFSLMIFFIYLTVTIYSIVGFIMQDSSSSFTIENASATMKWNNNGKWNKRGKEQKPLMLLPKDKPYPVKPKAKTTITVEMK